VTFCPGRSMLKPLSSKAQLVIYGSVAGRLLDQVDQRWPASIWEYRRAFRRCGIRVRLVPRGTCSEPYIRFTCPDAGVLYLPAIRDRTLLERWLRHELAEAMMATESGTPFVYPPAWGTLHDMARMVEIASGQE
jgi:hypothetical protein